MLLPSTLRVANRDILREIRNSQQTITLVEPTLATCTTCGGNNAFLNVSVAVPCRTCGGSGKTASSYKRSTLRVNLALVEFPQLEIFKGLPPGVEAGDYLVWVGHRDYDEVNAAMKNKDAYLSIYGEYFRLYGMSADGVGYADEYRLVAKKFKPAYVAP